MSQALSQENIFWHWLKVSFMKHKKLKKHQITISQFRRTSFENLESFSFGSWPRKDLVDCPSITLLLLYFHWQHSKRNRKERLEIRKIETCS